MSRLTEYGLIGGRVGSTATIFERLFPDFLKIPYSQPHEYITECWAAYESSYPKEAVSTNGKYFELCIATLLIREGLTPFYMGARITFIPNVVYDFILYSPDNGPICISAKTSLRERYKQADLEALALKNVHRKSESYLVTLDERESAAVNEKVGSGDVLALNLCVYAKGLDLDRFIGRLKQLKFSEAPTVPILSSEKMVTR